jgi:hypothetical protein
VARGWLARLELNRRHLKKKTYEAEIAALEREAWLSIVRREQEEERKRVEVSELSPLSLALYLCRSYLMSSVWET